MLTSPAESSQTTHNNIVLSIPYNCSLEILFVCNIFLFIVKITYLSCLAFDRIGLLLPTKHKRTQALFAVGGIFSDKRKNYIFLQEASKHCWGNEKIQCSFRGEADVR